ncbi:hypothetical protein DFP72DRAFT_881796 [Ephemerocybe angulata]|uniref:BTB domain-containing protein n=1 Tax=Ephemerocybe angulata TaxID=980116 RepID=A0A8H6I8J4_9AGAR|nr:hypothetical protein DFP72DRAFT_881796 [Tulosesus angulatus]
MAEDTTEKLAATTSAGRVEEFYWDNVVFKVENSLFKVPRDRFIAQSEVFAGMFGYESGEGRSDKNPIVLEGYKVDDFNALLKAIYPPTLELNGGASHLTKAEMKSVLKLSTAWEMRKIREYAILHLSGSPVGFFQLDPSEKIILAREHRVSKWFIEGITSLVKDDPNLSLDDLEACVGLRTAYRIVGIKLEQCNASRTIRPGFGPSQTYVVDRAILDAFKDEIDEMVKDERQYEVEFEEMAGDFEDNGEEPVRLTVQGTHHLYQPIFT